MIKRKQYLKALETIDRFHEQEKENILIPKSEMKPVDDKFRDRERTLDEDAEIIINMINERERTGKLKELKKAFPLGTLVADKKHRRTGGMVDGYIVNRVLGKLNAVLIAKNEDCFFHIAEENALLMWDNKDKDKFTIEAKLKKDFPINTVIFNIRKHDGVGIVIDYVVNIFENGDVKSFLRCAANGRKFLINEKNAIKI